MADRQASKIITNSTNINNCIIIDVEIYIKHTLKTHSFMATHAFVTF